MQQHARRFDTKTEKQFNITQGIADIADERYVFLKEMKEKEIEYYDGWYEDDDPWPWEIEEHVAMEENYCEWDYTHDALSDTYVDEDLTEAERNGKYVIDSSDLIWWWRDGLLDGANGEAYKIPPTELGWFFVQAYFSGFRQGERT